MNTACIGTARSGTARTIQPTIGSCGKTIFAASAAFCSAGSSESASGANAERHAKAIFDRTSPRRKMANVSSRFFAEPAISPKSPPPKKPTKKSVKSAVITSNLSNVIPALD